MAYTYIDPKFDPFSFNLPLWSVTQVDVPPSTYLKPGWDEKHEWNVSVDTSKEDTAKPSTASDKIDAMKKSRQLKNFVINVKDFTALLQGNCWLRCKGFPKGATVVECFINVSGALTLQVHHPSFPKVPVTHFITTTLCDTKQFVRNGKKKDKVQNAHI